MLIYCFLFCLLLPFPLSCAKVESELLDSESFDDWNIFENIEFDDSIEVIPPPLTKKRPREYVSKPKFAKRLKLLKLATSQSNSEIMNTFESFSYLRERAAFLYKLLLAKYRKGIKSPTAERILWSRVRVLGWPEELKSFNYRDFSNEQCLVLLQNMDKIEFQSIRNVGLRSADGNGKVNQEFFKNLQQNCRPEFCTKKGQIRWNRLHELEPRLVLKTHDYRIWTSDDRKLIEELILNRFTKKEIHEQLKSETELDLFW